MHAQHTFKKRQPTVRQSYGAQLRLLHSRFALLLLHYCRQLLLVADEHKPSYGRLAIVTCAQQSDEMRLQNLRRLVHDGEVEASQSEQLRVRAERRHRATYHPCSCYQLPHAVHRHTLQSFHPVV